MVLRWGRIDLWLTLESQDRLIEKVYTSIFHTQIILKPSWFQIHSRGTTFPILRAKQETLKSMLSMMMLQPSLLRQSRTLHIREQTLSPIKQSSEALMQVLNTKQSRAEEAKHTYIKISTAATTSVMHQNLCWWIWTNSTSWYPQCLTLLQPPPLQITIQ